MEAIKQAKAKSKKRNFVQSLDMIINVKGIDYNKVENRLNLEIALPKGLGKKSMCAVIADDDLLAEAKKVADKVLTKEDLNRLAADKKAAKKVAEGYRFFIAQASLMPLVGKTVGQTLGPRGKMPSPVPGNAKLGPLIERLGKTVKIRSKGKYLPTFHAVIGSEEMTDEDLAENANAVVGAVKDKLPNREGNIRSIFIKTSMGEPVKAFGISGSKE